MSIAVSVIVPAYNAEKTVGKTLDSLLSQTLKNIEIIVVDDASRDDTKRIVSEYAEKDARIRFFPQEKNAGPSAARNFGMQHATGEYIGFVDSDDWCEPEMFEQMYMVADDADIVVSGALHDVLDDAGSIAVQTVDKTGVNEVISDKKDITACAARLDGQRLFAYAWNKLYRTRFVMENHVLFVPQTLNEDYIFNCELWETVHKLVLTDGAYYHYIKFSKDSLTQKFLPDYFEIMDKRYTLMRDMFKKEAVFCGDSRAIICNMHIKHMIAGFVRNFSEKSNYTSKQQKQVIREVLANPNCREAMQFAAGKRKQEIISNLIFKSKSVTLNYWFAKMIYKMQNSENKLFDKLK